VLRYLAKAKSQHADTDHVLLHVEAGHNWHQLVNWTIEQQLWGLENLALIPGSVGAAPVQNIGAYGVELANVLTAVQVFDRHTHHVIWLPASDCAFGYRESHFKNTWSTRYIICAIRLQLALQPIIGVRYAGLADLPDDATSMAIFERVCFVRQQKLPDPMLLANAGSFFKNPIVSQATYLQLQASYPDVVAYPVEDLWKIAAGWLIEKAGWKGFCKDEQVGVYNKQALVLVNYQATTSDLLLWLQKTITDDIYNRFGICLEREPALLGQPPP
jgi:UDP-N-acetylmuramate dehydrogenase